MGGDHIGEKVTTTILTLIKYMLCYFEVSGDI